MKKAVRKLILTAFLPPLVVNQVDLFRVENEEELRKEFFRLLFVYFECNFVFFLVPPPEISCAVHNAHTLYVP